MENLNGLMVRNTKDIGKMENNMVRVSLSRKEDRLERVNGRMVKEYLGQAKLNKKHLETFFSVILLSY